MIANLIITNLRKKTLLSCFCQKLLEYKYLWFRLSYLFIYH